MSTTNPKYGQFKSRCVVICANGGAFQLDTVTGVREGRCIDVRGVSSTFSGVGLYISHHCNMR